MKGIILLRSVLIDISIILSWGIHVYIRIGYFYLMLLTMYVTYVIASSVGFVSILLDVFQRNLKITDFFWWPWNLNSDHTFCGDPAKPVHFWSRRYHAFTPLFYSSVFSTAASFSGPSPHSSVLIVHFPGRREAAETVPDNFQRHVNWNSYRLILCRLVGLYALTHAMGLSVN